MVEVVAAVDRKGLLRTCSISGHANSGPMGQDIVCAAVSVLARTATAVLSDRDGVVFSVRSSKRGELNFKADCTEAGEAFLYAAGVFLVEGLRSVAAEYPVNCSLKVIEYRS
jgi:uncharacterized protein YsxB (DUF464 family)